MLQLPLSLSAQRSWILKFTINPSVEKCFPLSCGVRISAISALLAPTEIIFGHLLEQSTTPRWEIFLRPCTFIWARSCVALIPDLCSIYRHLPARQSNTADSLEFVLLRSEIPSGMCAKLRTVATSNNRDHARKLPPRTPVIMFNRSHVNIGRAFTPQSLLLLLTRAT